MAFNDSPKILARFYLFLLSMSICGFSVTSECDDFDLKSLRNNGGGWRCVCFQDSPDCFMCRQYSQNINRAELVLPCFVPSGSLREADIQITYLFRRGNSGSGDSNQVPLNVHEEVGTNCHDGYFSAKLLDEALMTPRPQRPRRSTFRADNLLLQDINPATSYRLNIVESMETFPPMSIVCLTNVEFIRSETTLAATTEKALTTTNVTTSKQVRSETTLTATTEKALTTTNITTSKQEQARSITPTLIIILILTIVVIVICAVAGVFIWQRKFQMHQPTGNVNTGRVNSRTNRTQNYMNNDEDVIPNPTYGQEPVNEKEEEYHSYTEIDVKVAGNSEMTYNSAYESLPTSTDMVYNCPHESEDTKGDVIYHSVNEDPPSN